MIICYEFFICAFFVEMTLLHPSSRRLSIKLLATSMHSTLWLTHPDKTVLIFLIFNSSHYITRTILAPGSIIHLLRHVYSSSAIIFWLLLQPHPVQVHVLASP